MAMTATKPTFIYGLIDPRNQQLRYVGKTVLAPQRRTDVHRLRARAEPHKRHSMAWILGLEREGLKPEIEILETIEPGGNWVEAEQFWIAYFRMVGANLCNHSAGGEGQTGVKQSPETIAKRVMRGPRNPRFGKPLPPEHRDALNAGRDRFYKDQAAVARLNEKRKKTMSSPAHVERMKKQNARLLSDPEYKAALDAKRTEAARRPESRKRVGDQSRELWATKRTEIIAAQNAGKGEDWRRKQSERGKKKLADPDHPLRLAAIARRRLSDEDIAEIRRRISEGEKVTALAREYGVSQPHISHIKSGRSR